LEAAFWFPAESTQTLSSSSTSRVTGEAVGTTTKVYSVPDEALIAATVPPVTLSWLGIDTASLKTASKYNRRSGVGSVALVARVTAGGNESCNKTRVAPSTLEVPAASVTAPGPIVMVTVSIEEEGVTVKTNV
jgi:hypothetical protein